VYGFRVPLIVISPYVRPAYISHVNHDFGSILNFIEQVFRLKSLGYADAILSMICRTVPSFAQTRSVPEDPDTD
jgi:hypothetical protein